MISSESPDLEIRKALLKDLEEILAIENVSFPTPYTLRLFQTELYLDIAHLLVARQRGKVVGYIDFWHVGPEIHLVNIAVHPDSRRHRIGESLIKTMIRYGEENRIEEIYLDVRVSNKAAIALYEKYGFRTSSVRKAYYKDNNEDALVMRKGVMSRLVCKFF
ncbi:MAG: ribosomal protein S18-alanine N-acetyltransferase [Deltaproteobacteria bacterium]|nr:ribosomal protein S18-alanine N-acetyltransferase [Deltaproteobacteria bacterium]